MKELNQNKEQKNGGESNFIDRVIFENEKPLTEAEQIRKSV